MYEANAKLVWAEYEGKLSGCLSGLWCIFSDAALSDAARTAIGKSAAALGYGEASCTFVSQTGSLSAHDVFTITEGIDPLCAIATDETSARALAGAYGQTVPLDASCRLFGRDVVAFRSFEALLDSAEHKQKAWALLKQLPRI